VKAAQRAALGVAVVIVAAVAMIDVVTACSDFTTAATDPGDSGATDASASGDGDDVDGQAIAEPEQDAMASAPPGLVVANESKLGRLVVGPANVYYTQDFAQGAIMRVDKTAANAKGMTVAPDIAPTDIALVGSTLYATSSSNNAIVALDTTQLGSVTSAKSVTAPGAVVADAMAVAFLETTGTSAGAYSLFPDFVAAPMQLMTGAGPTAVAMDARSVYAAIGPRVQRYTRSGGITVASGTVKGGISVVEIGGDTLYLASGSTVLTLPALFGTVQAPAKLHEYGIGAEVTAIRATDGELFVATQGAVSGGTVHRLPLPGAVGIGSVVSRFADADCKLPDLVVDESSIYFLCNSAAGVGSVWRVARPAK
jgi:hypothetical protein